MRRWSPVIDHWSVRLIEFELAIEAHQYYGHNQFASSGSHFLNPPIRIGQLALTGSRSLLKRASLSLVDSISAHPFGKQGRFQRDDRGGSREPLFVQSRTNAG
jgi:hypothetical protein